MDEETPKILATFNAYDHDEMMLYANALNENIAWYQFRQDVRQIWKYRELSDECYRLIEEIKSLMPEEHE